MAASVTRLLGVCVCVCVWCVYVSAWMDLPGSWVADVATSCWGWEVQSVVQEVYRREISCNSHLKGGLPPSYYRALTTSC